MSERDRMDWDRLAGRYDRVVRLFGGRYDAVRERLRRDLDGVGDVLEVAAGTGQFTSDVAAVVGRLVATDRSPAMVRRLRERLAAADRGTVEVRVTDADAIDQPDASFDAVLAANLLHVMERPDVAMNEFRRVLRPRGLLLAPTFCHGETLVARFTSSTLSLVSDFVAHTRHSAESLGRFVDACGFDVEAVENLGGWLPEVYVRARLRSRIP